MAIKCINMCSYFTSVNQASDFKLEHMTLTAHGKLNFKLYITYLKLQKNVSMFPYYRYI